MRTKLSTCLRKSSFTSPDDAIAAAAGSPFPLRPYRCDRCGAYHLTSRTKGKWLPRPSPDSDD